MGFRDPYVIQVGGSGNDWRIVIGSGIDGKGGALLVYASTELTTGARVYRSAGKNCFPSAGDADYWQRLQVSCYPREISCLSGKCNGLKAHDICTQPSSPSTPGHPCKAGCQCRGSGGDRVFLRGLKVLILSVSLVRLLNMLLLKARSREVRFVVEEEVRSVFQLIPHIRSSAWTLAPRGVFFFTLRTYRIYA